MFLKPGWPSNLKREKDDKVSEVVQYVKAATCLSEKSVSLETS